MYVYYIYKPFAEKKISINAYLYDNKLSYEETMFFVLSPRLCLIPKVFFNMMCHLQLRIGRKDRERGRTQFSVKLFLWIN